MRAISLWQPWASAMATGAKTIETRHWSTNVRGPVAIHAAQRRVISELIGYGCRWSWLGVLAPLGAEFGDQWRIQDELPFGAIVAVGNLVDCRPTESFTVGELDSIEHRPDDTNHSYAWTQRMLGDFSLGRFGWVFEDIRPLTEPIPYKGRQGFFNIPDEIISLKTNLGEFNVTNSNRA